MVTAERKLKRKGRKNQNLAEAIGDVPQTDQGTQIKLKDEPVQM